jgi:hypothetical protein
MLCQTRSLLSLQLVSIWSYPSLSTLKRLFTSSPPTTSCVQKSEETPISRPPVCCFLLSCLSPPFPPCVSFVAVAVIASLVSLCNGQLILSSRRAVSSSNSQWNSDQKPRKCVRRWQRWGDGPDALREVYESLSIGFWVNRVERLMKSSLWRVRFGMEEVRGSTRKGNESGDRRVMSSKACVATRGNGGG